MRQHIEVDGKWMQKRAQGKIESYDLCANCVLRDAEPYPCKKVMGMANFCTATKVSILIWACPEFEAIEAEEEVEEKEDEVAEET